MSAEKPKATVADFIKRYGGKTETPEDLGAKANSIQVVPEKPAEPIRPRQVIEQPPKPEVKEGEFVRLNHPEVKPADDGYIKDMEQFGGDGTFDINELNDMKKSVEDAAGFMGDVMEKIVEKHHDQIPTNSDITKEVGKTVKPVRHSALLAMRESMKTQGSAIVKTENTTERRVLVSSNDTGVTPATKTIEDDLRVRPNEVTAGAGLKIDEGKVAVKTEEPKPIPEVSKDDVSEDFATAAAQITVKEKRPERKFDTIADKIKYKYMKTRPSSQMYIPDSKLMVKFYDVGDNELKNTEIYNTYVRDSVLYESISTLNLIMENIEIECLEGDTLTLYDKMRSIKYTDMNILFFMFGKNMVMDDQSFIDACAECGTQNKVNISMDKVIQNAINKSPNFIKEVKNYNPNESLTSLIDKSGVDKAFDLKYSDSIYKANMVIQDCSLYRYVIVTEMIKSYVINKFRFLLPADLINKGNNDESLKYLCRIRDKEISDISKIGNLLFFINYVELVDLSDDSKSIIDLRVDDEKFLLDEDIVGAGLEALMILFKEAQDTLMVTIGETLSKNFANEGSSLDLRTEKYKCRKCGHEQSGEVDAPPLLELFLMQKATPQ